MSLRAKRLVTLLVVVLFLGAGAGGAWVFLKNKNRAEREAARLAGLEAFEAADYETALQELNTFASRDQTDPEVMYKLAYSRTRVPAENRRHLLSGLRMARAARDLDPNDADTLRLIMDLYERLSRYRELADVADDLLAQEPDNRDAHRARITGLRLSGQDTEALQAARAMGDVFPADMSVQSVIVQIMSDSGTSDVDLLAYTQELFDRNSSSADFALLHMRVLARSRMQQEMLAIAARLPELQVQNAGTLRELVAFLDLFNMPETADEILEIASFDEALAEQANLQLAERRWKAGESAEAGESIAPLLDPVSEADTHSLAVGVMIFQFSLADEATGAPLLAELSARTGADAEAWQSVIAALTSIRNSDHRAAKDTLLGRSVHLDSSAYASYLLGLSEMGLREFSLASESFRTALRESPRWLAAYLNLIDASMRQNDPIGALRIAELGRQQFPRSTPLLLWTARAATGVVESGDATPDQIESALALLEFLTEQNVAIGESTTLKIRILAATGDTEGAAGALRAYLDKAEQPDTAEITQLLRVTSELDAPALRDRLLALADSQTPSPELVLARARALADAGRADEGEALLRESLASADSESNAGFREALAVYLAAQNDAEGMQILLEISEANPDSAQAQLGVLSRDLAWSSPESVEGPLSRLADIVGQESTIWRTYEARRVLTFEPSEREAARIVTLLDEVVRREPENSTALVYLADAMVRLGDLPAAAEYLDRALDSAPSRIELYPALIRLLRQTARSDAADRRMDQFVDLGDVRPSLRRERAELLIAQGDWQRAEADLRSLDTEQDAIALARLLIRRGRAGEAATELEPYLSEPEPSIGVLTTAAAAAATTGGAEAGIPFLARLEPSLEPVRYTQILASFHEQYGDPAEAERLFAQAAESDESGDAWADLAAFHLRRNQRAEADRAIQTGLARHPRNEELLAIVSATDPAAGGTGGATPAQQALINARRLQPAQGASATAYLQALKQVTEDHPTFLAGYQALAIESLRLGRAAEALDAARVAARVLPAEPEAARLAAEVTAQAGLFTEAIAFAEEWRDLTLTEPYKADLFLARLYSATADPSAAFERLSPHTDRIIAGASRPDGAGASELLLLLTLMVGEGQSAQVRAIVDEHAEPGMVWGAAYLGAAEPLLLDQDAGSAWLEHAPEVLDLEDPMQRLLLAKRWFDLAATQGAAEYFERARRLAEPAMDDPGVGLDASRIYATSSDQLGDHAAAERTYRAILERSPDDPEMLNNLSFMLTQTQGGSTEAVEFARRAVANARDSGLGDPIVANMLDTLGSAQLAIGAPADAAASFREGLELTPSNPDLIVGLGRALVAIGLDEATALELGDLIARLNRLDLRGALPDRLAPSKSELEDALASAGN